MTTLLLLLVTAIASPKVDVTVACCPLAIATKEAAARYGGMQFAGGGMSQMKKGDDGKINANDPVFNKLRQASAHAEGTATVDHDQLVIAFSPGADLSRLRIYVDGNGEQISAEAAAKLGLRSRRLKQGTYPAGAIVRIPLQK